MKITSKQINDAAKVHAQSVLGNQFKANPDAAAAVQNDFKEGFKCAVKLLSKAK
ncbi:hypothetical protein ACVWYN_002711 [Pedobacter sp. UYP24]